MSGLFDAIAAADFVRVRQILDAATDSVNSTAKADRLIESIPHWLYTGDTPLHLAAAALNDEIVALLIDRGADPRAVNRRGASPLHYACDPRPRLGVWDPERQVRIIERLIAAGAVVDLDDAGDVTPLHRAVRARSVAAVDALLRNGARVSNALLRLASTGSGASGTAHTADEQTKIIEALRAGYKT